MSQEAAQMKTVCPHFCHDCFAMRVCPTHALSEEPQAIKVDAELCISCATCKSLCTTYGYKALEKYRLQAV